MSEQGERDPVVPGLLAAREALRLLEELASQLPDGCYTGSLLNDVLPALRRVPPEKGIAWDFFKQPAESYRNLGALIGCNMDMLNTVIGANEELKKHFLEQGQGSELVQQIQEWLGYQIISD